MPLTHRRVLVQKNIVQKNILNFSFPPHLPHLHQVVWRNALCSTSCAPCTRPIQPRDGRRHARSLGRPARRRRHSRTTVVSRCAFENSSTPPPLPRGCLWRNALCATSRSRYSSPTLPCDGRVRSLGRSARQRRHNRITVVSVCAFQNSFPAPPPAPPGRLCRNALFATSRSRCSSPTLLCDGCARSLGRSARRRR